MQQKLLAKCHQIMKASKDSQETRRLEVIKQMLETPNCFLHLSANVGINILMQLGFKKEQAKRLFLQLSSFKIFKEGQK